MRASFIYFVQGEQGGPIKIGVAQDVKKRVRELQANSPVTLALLGSVAGTIFDERRLHEELKAHRLHGEWFADVPEVHATLSRERSLDDEMSTFELPGLTHDESVKLMQLTRKLAVAYADMFRDEDKEAAA